MNMQAIAIANAASMKITRFLTKKSDSLNFAICLYLPL